MSISNYGERYLDHKTFLKLCTDLKINSLGSRNDEAWLELLEREKILFPICRIVYPFRYIKKISSIFYNPSDPQFRKYTYCLPEKFSVVSKLKSNLEDFRIRNSLFHILDKRKIENKKYIRNPKRSKFIKWENYKKFVGKFNGHDRCESIAEHLYSYWQAYYFYEITKASTVQCIVNYFNEEMNGIFLSKKILEKKIFMRRSSIRYPKYKGDFLGEAKNFDALSFYIQSLNQLGNFTYGNFKNMFDEKLKKRYFVFRKKIAHIVINKYNLNITELFNFLKFLSKKYYDFDKEKKVKLVEMIKLDIDNLILLMMEGYDQNYDEINKKLGRVIPNFKNTLDVIFPKPFADERENILDTLASPLSSDLNFYKFENVTKEEIKLFIEFLDENNLQLFYYSLGQINITQFNNQSIYLHVLYLSLLLENVIKIIGRNSKNNKLAISLKYGEMKKILSKFFEPEGWIHSLMEHWADNTTIDSLTNINNKIFKNIAKGKFHKKEEWNRIIQMFLTCGLARNIAAHEHSKVITNNLDLYLTLLNNVVSAIWFTWKYAKSKGYISSEN